MSQLLEDLEKVRAQIEKGWCKSQMMDNRGNPCLDGAIVLACGYHPLHRLPHMFWREGRGGDLVKAIIRQIPGQHGAEAGPLTIARWNDNATTTKEDVLDLVCKAVRTEAEKEGIELVSP